MTPEHIIWALGTCFFISHFLHDKLTTDYFRTYLYFEGTKNAMPVVGGDEKTGPK